MAGSHYQFLASIFSSLLFISLVSGCGVPNADLVKGYNDFGVKCAKMGLWNEAVMRWERVIEIEPDNAEAHNNLGVAYESRGEFEAALAEYRTAIDLDPGNKTYMSNYIKFKRNYERTRKIYDPRLEIQDPRQKTENSRLKIQDGEETQD
jgi:tetratricopeptide (TPR) repeat protein